MEGFSRTPNYPGNVKARIISKIVGILLKKSSRLARSRAAIAEDFRIGRSRSGARGCPAVGRRRASFAQLRNLEPQLLRRCRARPYRPQGSDEIRGDDRECETGHMRIAAPALLLRAAGGGLSRIAAMTTRRMMHWWFRFVLSGRFLDRFLSLPRAH